MLLVQTMHSRSLGVKMKNSLLFTTDWNGQLLFLPSVLTGGVACTMFCSWLRKTPLPALAFIAPSPLYKWHWCYSLLWRGRWYLSFASSRHGPRPSFGLNKFFILTINLTALTIRRLCVIIHHAASFQICYADLGNRRGVKNRPNRLASSWLGSPPWPPSLTQVKVLILACSH
jgi:hypothetical protein